ncbi:MAG: RNA polymerase factor sigma-54, partial [Lentisphaeria bacterium]|nr:RNA polymerase factor sigma-54 [Lentisphaeria bacterium]NQZ70932.1 RNA polymerase factor sigma-54 [Lentisphaeria bacterium]
SAADFDENLIGLVQLDGDFRDYVAPSHATQVFSSDDAERRRHFFDSLSFETTLEEELLEQMRTSESSAKVIEAGELIIGHIDETGYLSTGLDNIAATNFYDIEILKKALALIQKFEPAGMGAIDLRECLLIQLRLKGDEEKLAYKLVDKYLDDLSKNKIPYISRALNISSLNIYEAWEEIKNLQPRPGLSISSGNIQFVQAEVTVSKENGQFEIVVNRDYIPKIGISDHYMQLLESPDVSSEIKQYLREKIMNGKQLMKSLDQRQSTIEKITYVLLDKQIDFFEDGEDFLRPLTMGEVADIIGVHETTVSRAIANKYIETPHGLMPMRKFFSTGFKTEEGELLSTNSIKYKIQAMIAEEESAKPLSDQKLCDLLKVDGLEVARRTVAKYREELEIPSSHLRKSHN